MESPTTLLSSPPLGSSSPLTAPMLGIGEVIKNSGKFAKPTRIPGKNYCKDEVVIRNSDSGKGEEKHSSLKIRSRNTIYIDFVLVSRDKNCPWFRGRWMKEKETRKIQQLRKHVWRYFKNVSLFFFLSYSLNCLHDKTVMGIKGRRVHMIEELSDTIISFQRGKKEIEKKKNKQTTIISK